MKERDCGNDVQKKRGSVLPSGLVGIVSRWGYEVRNQSNEEDEASGDIFLFKPDLQHGADGGIG